MAAIVSLGVFLQSVLEIRSMSSCFHFREVRLGSQCWLGRGSREVLRRPSGGLERNYVSVIHGRLVPRPMFVFTQHYAYFYAVLPALGNLTPSRR